MSPSTLLDTIPNELLKVPANATLKFDFDIYLEWSNSEADQFPAPSAQMGTNEVNQKLFEDESNKDFTIVVANGKKIKCHGAMLAGL